MLIFCSDEREEDTASDPEGRAEEDPLIISLAMEWGSTLRGFADSAFLAALGLGRGADGGADVVPRDEFRMRRRPEPLTVEKLRVHSWLVVRERCGWRCRQRVVAWRLMVTSYGACFVVARTLTYLWSCNKLNDNLLIGDDFRR